MIVRFLSLPIVLRKYYIYFLPVHVCITIILYGWFGVQFGRRGG